MHKNAESMNTWGFVNSVAPCLLPRREGLHWEASCREELRRGALPELFYAQSSPTESADHAGAVCFPAPRALPRPARRKPLFSAQRISPRPAQRNSAPRSESPSGAQQKHVPRTTKNSARHATKTARILRVTKTRPAAQVFPCGRGGFPELLPRSRPDRGRPRSPRLPPARRVRPPRCRRRCR